MRMELGFQGKNALITGGAKGIGKACALSFAREGVDVIINDYKDATNAELTAQEVRKLGRRAMVVIADVANETEVNKMVDQVIQKWGGIDILVNNAGVSGIAMIEDTKKSDWDRVLGVDLDGTFYCSKAVIGTMKKRGGGKIVNISSIAGLRIPAVAACHYTAAKAGVLGLTRHFAWELAHFNINVNAVCPGNIRTEMFEKLFTPDEIENIRRQYPLGELPTMEDIANTVLFLASDRARMIIGCSIVVDGGFTLSTGGMDWDHYVRKKKEAGKKIK